MRISDWSSDVCSSDLADRILREDHAHHHGRERRRADVGGEAGAQQVDRDKGHYGGVEESEDRSEEHTSELQSLMRISYAVFCLKKKKQKTNKTRNKLKTSPEQTTKTR